MSRYILRGTSGPGDEPNDEDPLSHFSTDLRWEIGYYPRWFTFYAALLDADDEASPVFVVGAGPCEWPTVEALNSELDAITMWVPAAVAAAQRRHLAGHMGEPREEIDRRLRTVRHAALVEFVAYWIRPTMRPSV